MRPTKHAAIAISIIFAILLSSTRLMLTSSAPAANGSASDLRELIESYNTDRGSVNRTYPDSLSPTRHARLKQFYEQWRESLAKVNFDTLGEDGRIDYLLFKNHLEHELRQLDLQVKQWTEVEAVIPFAQTIWTLDEARRRMEAVKASQAATQLTEMTKQVADLRKGLGTRAGAPAAKDETEGQSDGESRPERATSIKLNKSVANRAASNITSLRNTLRNWFEYYNGYDPSFSWWVAEPFKSVDQALQGYGTAMSERAGMKPAETPATGAGGPPRTGGGNNPDAVGNRGNFQRNSSANARPGDISDIVGDPIGREALLTELAAEMIPYTPEELIAIANKEFAWCEGEMKKASRELGHGDDWKKALEVVKQQYVEPGEQPKLIRDLANEAIEYVQKNDLVTVPPLARESWRMQMMTPERQLVNPFFTGGEVISVSYPTNTMSHEQKMMSMRGNNIHFARATVFHELIPGHHLQGYMSARYKPYRSPFRTPFWGEGWALYWELLLYDMGFPKTPENRIGMLFWRMHRCARIIFSLSFHLGQMSPKECIDMLVKRVGHEPENATAEVRRSFDGSYPPLYQAAYLLGGMQIYSLHKELVGSGKMTNRAFHDAVLQENSIPIEMIRASLTKQKLTRDFVSNWRFN